MATQQAHKLLWMNGGREGRGFETDLEALNSSSAALTSLLSSNFIPSWASWTRFSSPISPGRTPTSVSSTVAHSLEFWLY